MKTVADPIILSDLVERLGAVGPESTRRWGSLTAHEMLCHLGDATAMVLGTRPRKDTPPLRTRRLLKWIGLWSPIRWPRGWAANPAHDPKADGTKPTEFETDLARAIEGLRGVASASDAELTPVHGVFGRMSHRDWKRCAYKHTDHHLRQFGV
ncbi:MAG: hypothetical protein KJO65_09865 [Gemmatimonadetes bacterium]|nr:hypothetical protein [Gemmatimonadota bacterium]